ncbi:MAG: septum formation family protein [Acidimicrobiia bacterium]
MERKCPSCGADPGTGAFCQNCGNRLAEDGGAVAGDASPPATPTPPPTPPQVPQQGPTTRRGCRTGCLTVGIIGVVLLAAGAFFGWRFISDEVLPGIEESTDAFTSVSESPPGPCFDLETDNGILTDWTEVSCDGPRHVEVSFAANFEDGPFPGDDYLVETASETCTTAFGNYVGVSPDESAYGVDWLLPSEEMWAQGVRNGICLVVSDDGSVLTGTIKGSET